MVVDTEFLGGAGAIQCLGRPPSAVVQVLYYCSTVLYCAFSTIVGVIMVINVVIVLFVMLLLLLL